MFYPLNKKEKTLIGLVVCVATVLLSCDNDDMDILQ